MHSSLRTCGALLVAWALAIAAPAPAGRAAAPHPDQVLFTPPPVPVVPPTVFGRARMIHPPTHCNVGPFVPGGPGIPYFVTDGVPRAGHPFHVQWTTRPTAPDELPAMPTLLMVALDPSPWLPMDFLGGPGCWLQVNPEFVMVPGAGSILTQEGGRVFLDWTPHFSVIGQEFWSQLLVIAPDANAGQFLVSPLLHVVIGS